MTGGYTTFSTYAVDIVLLIRAGHPATGLAYLTGTLGGALTSVTIGMLLTRRLLQRTARLG